MEYPKLREGLEAIPFEHENQEMFLLRDRLGFCDSPLAVSKPLALLLVHMDGRHSLRDLQEVFTRATGELLLTEKLREIITRLDEALFLDNDRFAEHTRTLFDRFMRDPVRHMQFHGKSYPEDPAQLNSQLCGFFSSEVGGPGLIDTSSPKRADRLLGVVAPHIDLQAGGPCFAHAYKAVAESAPPDTWVVLGTGHEPLKHFFALTAKDFETPLGTVGCDRELADALSRGAQRNIRASEYFHSREHTIEFQAVFLAWCQPGVQIVPVLCAFSHEDWAVERVYVDETAAMIRRVAQECGRRVGFVASVDLAHVGPRYGDGFRPDESTITEHLAADRLLLEDLERCDAVGFMRRIERENNRRKVCGVAPLYMLAKILEGQATGQTLHHTYATVDSQQSFVTFASMTFCENPAPSP